MSIDIIQYPLLTLMVVPLAGAVCCLLTKRLGTTAPMITGALFILAQLALLLLLAASPRIEGTLYHAEQYPWLTVFQVSVDLQLDGLNLYPLCAIALLALAALLTSADRAPVSATSLFASAAPQLAAAIMFLETSLVALFLTVDLLFFAGLSQLTVLCFYFLLGADADTDADRGKSRRAAAARFALFNLAGTSCLLFGSLVLKSKAALAGRALSAPQLQGMELPFEIEAWLLLAFLVCFAVQLPIVPLHGWFADVCDTAPSWVAPLVVGGWAVVGLYGLIRFCLPLFPQAVNLFAATGAILAAVTALYGGILAVAQFEVRRRVAWTIVSCNGLVMLGLCSGTVEGIHGGIISLIFHGIGRAALLTLAILVAGRFTPGLGRADAVGLQEGDSCSLVAGFRYIPLTAGLLLVAILCVLGVPGSAAFVGNLLLLQGALASGHGIAVALVTGGLLITAYSLMSMFHRLCASAASQGRGTTDLSLRHVFVLVSALALLIWFGLFPERLLSLLSDSSHFAEKVGALVADFPSYEQVPCETAVSSSIVII